MTPTNRSSPDILVAGDVLVDFLPTQSEEISEERVYAPRLGGSAANVAVVLDRLGAPPLFWTRFATDDFGMFLREYFTDTDIPTKYFVTDPGAKTTLAVVSHDSEGERSFSFYRNRGADTRLEPGTVDDETLADVSWLHTTGVTMSAEPSRTATLELLSRAHETGTVSLDPNWRPELWQSQEEYTAVIRGALADVDVLAAAVEDLTAAGFDAEDPMALAQSVTEYGPHTVIITLGEAGSLCVATSESGISTGATRHDGYEVDTVDTTGAGDAFLAGLIAALTNGVQDADRVLGLANAVGAVATTKSGAVAALSSLEGIHALRNDIPWV